MPTGCWLLSSPQHSHCIGLPSWEVAAYLTPPSDTQGTGTLTLWHLRLPDQVALRHDLWLRLTGSGCSSWARCPTEVSAGQ